MTTYTAKHSEKKKVLAAIFRNELSLASKGVRACYHTAKALKFLGAIGAVAILLYALLITRDPIDMIYAIPVILCFCGIGMIVGTVSKGSIRPEYRFRLDEKLAVLDDKMIYSYHDALLPQLNNRWSYEIPYSQIELAEVTANGYLVTLHGLFQGDLLIGSSSTNPDTWSKVVILDDFQCSVPLLLQEHGVNTIIK